MYRMKRGNDNYHNVGMSRSDMRVEDRSNISKEEVYSALKTVEMDKAPGVDEIIMWRDDEMQW